MSFVLTLIGTSSRPLTPDDMRAAEGALRRAGADTAPAVTLAPNLAADLPFESTPPERVMAAVRQLVNGVDAVAQPTSHRRKALLLADMDSTIIQVECIDELADFAGIKPKIAAITEQAMRGELAFEPALRARVALLEGLSVSVLERTMAERVRLTPGARTLVSTMRANGATTALVSGGFTFFTERVAALTGFDHHSGNTLQIDGSALTGTVGEPIFGRDAKLSSLVCLRGQLGISREATLAVGDGANDLDMLQEAGLGVAYHAKPIVAEAAAARIDYADLTALLYIQGYRKDEFVEEYTAR